MTSLLAPNPFYGFYKPRSLPAVSKADLELFQQFYRQPLPADDHGRIFFQLAPRILPTLAGPCQKVLSGDLGLNSAEKLVPYITKKKPILYLPRDLSLRDYFSPLVSALACYAPTLPELSSLNRSSSVMDLDNLRKCRVEMELRRALDLSFLYQVAHEMACRQIMDGQTEGFGILAASDLARFLVFRESGLYGLAPEYSRFLLAGATTLQNLSPPFALAKSPLDQWAETVMHFSETLYQQAFHMSQLNSKERSILLDGLGTRILFGKSLPELIQLINKMTPALAVSLLRDYDQDKVKLNVLPATRETEVKLNPTQCIRKAPHLLGLSLNERYSLEIPRGLLIKDILFPLVFLLSMAVMPDHFFKSWEGPLGTTLDDEYRLTRHMEINYVRQVMWGYTGLFEFVHEARMRGFDLQLSDVDDQKRSRLKKEGFLALCEQWETFEDPVVIYKLRTELALLSEQYLSEKG